MKLVINIRRRLILVLSPEPRFDRNNVAAMHQGGITAEHQHQNDDSCSITHVSDCCGIAMVYQPLRAFELDIKPPTLVEIASTYQSVYRFGHHPNIWQPPKLIGETTDA